MFLVGEVFVASLVGNLILLDLIAAILVYLICGNCISGNFVMLGNMRFSPGVLEFKVIPDLVAVKKVSEPRVWLFWVGIYLNSSLAQQHGVLCYRLFRSSNFVK